MILIIYNGSIHFVLVENVTNFAVSQVLFILSFLLKKKSYV